MQNPKLRSLLAQILKGYSIKEFGSLGKVFVKHLTLMDHSLIDINYSEFLSRAVKKQIPTKDEKKDFLIKEGSWSQKDEDKLNEIKEKISQKEKTRSQLHLPSQKDRITRDIKFLKKDLDKLNNQLEELIGYTAESYAAAKANELICYYSLFQDEKFKVKPISKEDFYELEFIEFNTIIDSISSLQLEFTSKSIKHLALNPIFFNAFSISSDNPMSFYGKPVCDLSIYQTDLFAYGKIFKNILSDPEVPDDIKNDPEALINWKQGSVSDGKSDKVKIDGAVSLVGATSEDLKRLGKDKNVVNLREMAQKKGGELTTKDFMMFNAK